MTPKTVHPRKSRSEHRRTVARTSRGHVSVRLWTAVVSYKGIIELAESLSTKPQALTAIVSHLRRNHGYDGPTTFSAATRWLAERDDRFEVQVFPQRCKLSDLAAAAMNHATCLNRATRHLRRDGFLVLTFDRSETQPDRRFEAWAYQGPLNFELASPLHFGLGASPVSALAALNHHLSRSAK